MEAQQHPKHLKLQLIGKLYTHKYLHYLAYECFKNINAGYQMDAKQIKSKFALIEFVYLDAGKNISQHSVADLNSFLRGGMQDDNVCKVKVCIFGHWRERIFVRMSKLLFFYTVNLFT